MSEDGKGKYFAIGLGTGVGVALLFLTWSVPPFREPSFSLEYFSNLGHYAFNSASADSRYWISHGWVFAEDSLAQWIVAALGIAATVISFLALRWLKKTWDQSRRAADAAIEAAIQTQRANELMLLAHTDQMRPYIYVYPESVLSLAAGTQPAVKLKIENQGKTPARFVRISCKLSLQEYPISSRGIGDHRIEKSHGKRIPDLSPGFPYEAEVHCDTIFDDEDCMRALMDDRHKLLVTGEVWYHSSDFCERFTVFGFWAHIETTGLYPNSRIESLSWSAEAHFSQTT